MKVVVHAKGSHVFKGVFLQLKFLNICKKDEKDLWIYGSHNSLQLTVYKHFSIGNIILLSTISLFISNALFMYLQYPLIDCGQQENTEILK